MTVRPGPNAMLSTFEPAGIVWRFDDVLPDVRCRRRCHVTVFVEHFAAELDLRFVDAQAIAELIDDRRAARMDREDHRAFFAFEVDARLRAERMNELVDRVADQDRYALRERHVELKRAGAQRHLRQRVRKNALLDREYFQPALAAVPQIPIADRPNI